MNDLEDFVPYIVAFIVAAFLFVGIISVVKKSMQPSAEPVVDSSETLKSQRRRMDDVQRRQKELMERQRQRIRDMQR